jgi:hypothetical protein
MSDRVKIVVRARAGDRLKTFVATVSEVAASAGAMDGSSSSSLEESLSS